MREHGKIQQREISKKRLENGYKVDKMEAMSSADFAPKEEPKPSSSSKESPSKFTDALNALDSKDNDSGFAAKKVPAGKNTFQQMLKDSEMKVSVAKKAPKKGMQLGKKKKEKKSAMMEEVEKQNIIEHNPVGEAAEQDQEPEEQKADGE